MTLERFQMQLPDRLHLLRIHLRLLRMLLPILYTNQHIINDHRPIAKRRTTMFSPLSMMMMYTPGVDGAWTLHRWPAGSCSDRCKRPLISITRNCCLGSGVSLTRSMIPPCTLTRTCDIWFSEIPIGASEVEPEQVTPSPVVTVKEQGNAHKGIKKFPICSPQPSSCRQPLGSMKKVYGDVGVQYTLVICTAQTPLQPLVGGVTNTVAKDPWPCATDRMLNERRSSVLRMGMVMREDRTEPAIRDPSIKEP